VALQAEAVRGLCAQEVLILAAMRLMAGGASLLESGLMQRVLLRLFRLIAVASQADIHRIRLGQSRLPAGVRIVTVRAISRCSRMRHLRLLNRVGLLGMASNAKVFRIGLREDNFSVLRGSMAGIARFIGKRWMQELPHQLRRGRLVRIVALCAVRFLKWLIVVRLLQRRVFHVVTIDAQRGRGLGQMEIKLRLADFADLMCRMAGIATHIKRRVAATLRSHIQPLRVALETKIRALISRCRLQQLIFVVALVRIVALDAITHRRRMHRTLQRRRIFFGMACQAHGLRRGSDQLDPRDLFVDANFMAAQASRRDRRVHSLALGLVLVTLEALRRIDVFLEWDRMFFRPCRSSRDQQRDHQHLQQAGEPASERFCFDRECAV